VAAIFTFISSGQNVFSPSAKSRADNEISGESKTDDTLVTTEQVIYNDLYRPLR